MSYWKFTIFASLTASFAEAAKQQGGAGTAELDEVKRMLVETNPWFLGLTGLVSILHVLYVLSLDSTPQIFFSLVFVIGSSSWPSALMSHIGARRRSLLVSLLGEYLSVCTILYHHETDLASTELYVPFQSSRLLLSLQRSH